MSLDLLREWMTNHLLPQRGKQLFRMKGVLSVAGSDQKFVYQAGETRRHIFKPPSHPPRAPREAPARRHLRLACLYTSPQPTSPPPCAQCT